MDFRQKRTGQIDINNMSPLSIGSIPEVITSDHVTNSIIKSGAKIWLPKGITCNKYTPKKNMPFILRMVEAGILKETKIKPQHTILMFAVPKSDHTNPRMILGFKPFTKSPKFKLPNITKLTQTASPKDYMIKLDLTNGFFHIKLNNKTNNLFGIKCQNKYFIINNLPQGLSISPYLMQRVMVNVVNKILEYVNVKIMIYLDDILLMGQPDQLEKAKTILFASSFLFNLDKCNLTPTKCLTYLGVIVDLTQKTLALTKNFVI